MDNVGLNTARPQPARQPEPVASGLVGDDNALDLATRLARFGAPTIQKLQQCFLVGLELLERLAFDPRNNRRDEPLRLAHLDHGELCYPARGWRGTCSHQKVATWGAPSVC